jgi:hypothetical protein
MFRVKKKNLIALALVTVLLASGIGVYQVKAAVKVDTNAKCSLTVQIPSVVTADQHVDGKIAGGIVLYDGDQKLSVKLYKIADVTEAGTFVSTLDGLTAFDDGKLTEDEAKNLAKDAYNLVDKANPAKTITMSPKATSSKTEENIPVGVYLYVPSISDTDRYSFEFTNGVISLPTSEYIQGGTKVGEHGEIVEATTSDKWNYDATVAIKSQAIQKWGKLKIEKTLSNYNESLGTASFVYSIEAKYGTDVVYSNVVSLDFTKPGTVESAELKIPAGTTVTVTEEETGASYVIDKVVNVDKIVAKDTADVAKFTNKYDDELQVGGISVVNKYSKNEAGEFKFDNKEVDVELKPIEEVAR